MTKYKPELFTARLFKQSVYRINCSRRYLDNPSSKKTKCNTLQVKKMWIPVI